MSSSRSFCLTSFVILLFLVQLNLCENDFLAKNVEVLRTVMMEANEKTKSIFSTHDNCSSFTASSYETSDTDKTIEEYLKGLDNNAIFEKIERVIHIL